MAGRGAGTARWYPTIVFWGLALVVVGHVLGYAFSRTGPVTEARSPLRALLAAFDATMTDDVLAGRSVRLGMGTLAGAFLVTCWVLVLFFFVRTRTTPFIYFQF